MVRIVALAQTGKRIDILYTGGVLMDAFSLLATGNILDELPFDASMLLQMSVTHITEEEALGIENAAAKIKQAEGDKDI